MKPFFSSSKSNAFALLICVCAFSSFATPAFAQDYLLDVSFGTNGFTNFSLDFRGLDYGLSVAILPDDKVITQGRDWGSSHHVYCLDKDGYNAASPSKILFSSNRGSSAMAVQSDAKLILACSPTKDIAIGRYIIDTTSAYYYLIPDSSYGIDGEVIPQYGAIAMKTQSDNKLIVASNKTSFYESDFAISRLNENGSVDSSFGINGTVITDFDYTDVPNSIAIQPDGKIIVGGTTTYKSGKKDFIVVRYQANGELDSSFGIDGKVFVSYLKHNTAVPTLGLQADGRIVVGGTINPDTDSSKFVLACLEPTNGDFDFSFGTNGWVTTSFDLRYDKAADNSIVIVADGKIVMTGTTYGTTNGYLTSYVALARYYSNGELDGGYGSGGKAVLSSQPFSTSTGLALQKNGKIVVVGMVGGLNYHLFSTMRFNTEGTLPITLSSFTAEKKDESILLNWQTSSESSGAYFIVERKSNFNTFTSIGQVAGKGNSGQPQQYGFKDLSPVSGTNYYRLKQIDADGKFSYSKTVQVAFGKDALIKLYPNPVKSILHIEGLDEAASNKLLIADVSGRIITTKALTGVTAYTWDVKQLPQGVYYLTIITGDTKRTARFVKE